MHYTIRPVTNWEGIRTPSEQRKRYQFTRPHPTKSYGREAMPWSDTLEILDRELCALDASAIVLQLDVRERDVRLDGQLRADARPSDPGVRLLFDSKVGPLTYQCDRFATWQDNARAIALGLEALRKVERYGITRPGQQYKGWLELESGNQVDHRAEAEKLLRDVAGHPCLDDSTPAPLAFVLRAARANAHPDRNQGDRTTWDAVERAAKTLWLTP